MDIVKQCRCLVSVIVRNKILLRCLWVFHIEVTTWVSAMHFVKDKSPSDVLVKAHCWDDSFSMLLHFYFISNSNRWLILPSLRGQRTEYQQCWCRVTRWNDPMSGTAFNLIKLRLSSALLLLRISFSFALDDKNLGERRRISIINSWFGWSVG